MAPLHPITILFSIDGMRPDAMMEADTPCMKALMEDGSYTLRARTVMPSVTLPCHTSMLRGVDVTRHGITSNTFTPIARPVPSVIDVARTAGLRTGFFFDWAELRDLAAPSSLDVAYSLRSSYTPEDDQVVARAAVNHNNEKPFDFLFVYLGYTDECGHKNGWMSRAYLDAISNADRCVNEVVQGVRNSGCDPSIVLLSDHGGHDRSHGTDCDEDMTIPWIASGRGIVKGQTLDADQIRIFDTAPTLAALLGLPMDREWDGRVVTEAMQSSSAS